MEKRVPENELGQAELQSFFLSHLNRIYCAKNQLLEKLPELGRQSFFLDLKQAIDETIDVVQMQLNRMRQIFIAMDTTYHYEHCTGLIGVLDEAFQSINPEIGSPALRDLSILFYMQNIESIEIASFKVLLAVAEKMGNAEISHLLLESFDEATEDKELFKQITANYF